MNNDITVTVVAVNEDEIIFTNGYSLCSYHDRECCEDHWLDFGHLSLSDFKGLEFDISNDNFFKRVEGFGIRLIPLNGYPISVPGYGENNGFYSDQMDLVLMRGSEVIKSFEVTECQSYI